MKQPTKRERRERLRLKADRLCYLAEGADGLRNRHGMQRADRKYRDQYDAEADRQASNANA